MRLNTDLQTTGAWDSAWSTGYIQIKVNPTMHNGLLMNDDQDPTKIKNDLAQSWTVSDDGLTYSVKLIPGIKFHDGSPLKASDVAFSYKRVSGEINTGYVSAVKNAVSDYVATYSTPDDVTVIFKMKQPAPAFINTLANLFTVIYSEALGFDYPKDINKSPVGTGPYKFLERKASDHISVRKNDAYFKKDESGDPLPYMDGVEFSIIPDTTLATAAVRAGQFLEADYLDPGMLNPIIDQFKKEKPDWNVGTGYGSWRHFHFNNKAPFSDVRVRRALDLLVDRPGFVTARYPGYGWAAASPLLPPAIQGRWGLTDDETAKLINTGPVDAARIAQAKALFQAANVTFDKFSFTLLSINTQIYQDDATFLQGTWNQAGLNVKLEVITSQEYVTRRAAGNFEVFYIPASSSADDPDYVLGVYYPTGSAQNFGKFSDAKVDDLYKQQSSTVDVVKRKAITQDLERYILTDANWYPKVAWAGSWVAWAPIVKAYNPVCPGAYCHRARMENTWLVNAGKT
ncbi:MAG: ABC transporter substrate-binding protein [Chloroflexi bacterium]|nr:ABC transporter substrate-binding protein [Chloroflexota bacterium]